MEEKRQNDIIDALLISKNYTEASKIANVSRKTIYNYLSDVTFVEKLKEAKRIKLRETIAKVEYASNTALDCILEAIESKDTKINIKLNTCLKLLDFFTKYRDIEGTLNNTLYLENKSLYELETDQYKNNYF